MLIKRSDISGVLRGLHRIAETDLIERMDHFDADIERRGELQDILAQVFYALNDVLARELGAEDAAPEIRVGKDWDTAVPLEEIRAQKPKLRVVED